MAKDTSLAMSHGYPLPAANLELEYHGMKISIIIISNIVITNTNCCYYFYNLISFFKK